MSKGQREGNFEQRQRAKAGGTRNAWSIGEEIMKRIRERTSALTNRERVLASVKGVCSSRDWRERETNASLRLDTAARGEDRVEGLERKFRQQEEDEADDYYYSDEDAMNGDEGGPPEKLFPAMTPRKPPQSARGRSKVAKVKEEQKVASGVKSEAKKKAARRESARLNDAKIKDRSRQQQTIKEDGEDYSNDLFYLEQTQRTRKTSALLLEKSENAEDMMEAKIKRESMTANNVLRFHREKLEEEDVRDLEARLHEKNEFRVFYLPPAHTFPIAAAIGPAKKNNNTNGSNSTSSVFAKQRSSRNNNNNNTNGIDNNLKVKKKSTSRTDSKGDYRARPGDHLAFRFEVKETLGSGTFGRVVKCVDHDVRSNDVETSQKRTVAIKIIKNKEEYRIQAKTELAVLEMIETARNDLAEREEEDDDFEETSLLRTNAECVVRAIEHFNFRTHTCIVFELLHCNLYEWMQNQRFVGASERICKTVAKQLARALSFLKLLGIIHCDVKPENILLEQQLPQHQPSNSANNGRDIQGGRRIGNGSHPSSARGGAPAQKYDSNIRVKLIDFGSSCFAKVPRVYPYVQSRFYRAPEVMLRDRQYDQSIDIWSFACVLAELKRGSPIWPGSDEAEQLELAKETLGAPSSSFLFKLRSEERKKKGSSSSDEHDCVDDNNDNKAATHQNDSRSLSRVVPSTPRKAKSRRLLAEARPLKHASHDIKNNNNEEEEEEEEEEEKEKDVLSDSITPSSLDDSSFDKRALGLRTNEEQEQERDFVETSLEKRNRRSKACAGIKRALGKGASLHFARFLQKCFEWDPDERFTADECLCDPWLREEDLTASTAR